MTAHETAVRQFTREEANRTLPLVRLIVRDIVELASDLQARRERLDAVRSRRSRAAVRDNDLYAEEFHQMQAELEHDALRLKDLIRELAELGVEMRDSTSGTVAFPGAGEAEGSHFFWKPGDGEVQLEPPATTMNLFAAPEHTDKGDGGLPGARC